MQNTLSPSTSDGNTSATANSSRVALVRRNSPVVSTRRMFVLVGQRQYSSASMMVMTRLVTAGSDGSGESE